MNMLGTKHLDVVLRVALEGPQDDYDYILVEAIELWRNSANGGNYTHLEKHLVGHSSRIGGNDDLHDFCQLYFTFFLESYILQFIFEFFNQILLHQIQNHPWPSIGKG